MQKQNKTPNSGEMVLVWKKPEREKGGVGVEG